MVNEESKKTEADILELMGRSLTDLDEFGQPVVRTLSDLEAAREADAEAEAADLEPTEAELEAKRIRRNTDLRMSAKDRELARLQAEVKELKEGSGE